jgi:crotonobetainyl-CoA:carnitine CoA-transferase CaiB-like acyl-CoA transferase
MNSSLKGLRVLDLSRVLAGPVCTQILGDLGADIIKIEKPGAGDDTRTWGPPYLQDANGNDTTESAYYLSCNRNKRSVTVDITQPEGQALIKKLIAQSDILIENFKVGGLAKYGLSYEQLKKDHPSLIYCAISGFGQNGPLAPDPGYDFLAQAMGGLMACTGPDGTEPMKTGVAIVDIMTGLYSAIGILSALHHREKTGEGQMVDLALLDVTLAGMTNIAQYYLTSGALAPRLGNAHSTIVPYQAFEAKDGHIVIAVGNNPQFARLAKFLGREEWADDPHFATNSSRVRNRNALCPKIARLIAEKDVAYWVNGLRGIDVPVAPVNTMEQAFAEPQVQVRDMQVALPHPLSPADIHLVGSPLKFSATPVTYERAPPTLGQHTDEVLRDLLGLSDEDIQKLKAAQAI